MSIQSEITRIEGAKNNIATAIEGKGVTVPASTKLDGYASLVNSISAGPSSSDAILRVLIYNGATISMTKGNVTLTPTTRTSSNDQYYEVALFVIESSKFDSQNAWILTSTINNLTYSGSICITTNADYYIELTRVPEDYQEVEYLYSKGANGSCIYIGITPSQVYGGTFGYQITSAAQYMFIWGAGKSTSDVGIAGTLGLACGTGTNRKGLLYGTTSLDAHGSTAGVRYDGSFSCSNGTQSQTTNNYTVSGSQTGDLTDEQVISIFSFNRGGTIGDSSYFKGYIYYLTFTDENGDLLRDLVPCYRKSDYVAGLWDRVSKTFMYPSTANVITPGPDIINVAKLVLYENGTFSYGYERSDITTNGSITENSDSVRVHTNSNSKAYVYLRWIAIDLTNYSYIYVYFNKVSSENTSATIWISDSESVTKFSEATSYVRTPLNDITARRVDLDVQNFTGEWYVAVGIDTNDASWNNARNVDIYVVCVY